MKSNLGLDILASILASESLLVPYCFGERAAQLLSPSGLIGHVLSNERMFRLPSLGSHVASTTHVTSEQYRRVLPLFPPFARATVLQGHVATKPASPETKMHMIQMDPVSSNRVPPHENGH